MNINEIDKTCWRNLKRCRVVYIPYDLLPDLILPDGCWRRLCIPGVPGDAQWVEWWHADGYRVGFKVRHHSFEWTPEGAHYPSIVATRDMIEVQQ